MQAEKQKSTRLDIISEEIQILSRETAKWNNDSIKSFVQANLEKAILKGWTEEQLREKITSQAIAKLQEINDRLSLLAKQQSDVQFTGEYLTTQKGETSKKIQKRLTDLESQYSGSDMEIHDRKLNLYNHLERDLETGYNHIQARDIDELYQLYENERVEAKLSKWKETYSKSGNEKIEKNAERELLVELKANFLASIKKYPTLANALKSIIRRIGQKDTVSNTNSFGLKPYQIEKFLKQAEVDLVEGLYYLMDHSGGSIYDLDQSKIKIKGLIDENIEFDAMVKLQITQNAKPKIAESQQRLEQEFDNTIERCRK